MDSKDISSNWKRLQASGSLTTANNKKPPAPTGKRVHVPKQNDTLKRKRTNIDFHGQLKHSAKRIKQRMSKEQVSETGAFVVKNGAAVDDGTSEQTERIVGDRINAGLVDNVDVGKYLAIDCEMVGVGPNPHLESALARVSVVNYNGEQVYDSYVKPLEDVTDWRTHVSGIQPKHMIHARTFEQAQADVASLLKGRIVVGHSVRRDFEALLLDHPKRDVRDTARHGPYRKLAGGGSPKLKILASDLLGLDIQTGEHSSIEDARATMLLFKRDKEAFEREHIKKWGTPTVSKKTGDNTATADSATKPKKKKKKKK